MTILILGSEEDEHATHMRDVLKARGADAALLDSRWFPSAMTISFDPATGAGALRPPGGRRLPFEEIAAVYWRTYHGVWTPELPDPEQGFIAENDARGLFESLLLRLPTRWVNGWNAFQLHQTKPAQLAIAADLGLAIPATIVANDATEIAAFAERHPKSIFKPVQGGAHARRLSRDHLRPENLGSLSVAPVTVQEEVPGTNVRAFVVGEQVLACEIGTGELDYRDDAAPLIRPHALPEATAADCRAVAAASDLVWTGIDFRLTPDGRYVFLEANPSPMFLGFEERTGLPLTAALADLLLGE